MSIPPFIIVADRSSMKSFRVEQTHAHGFMPRLVEAFQVSAAPDLTRRPLH